MPEPRPSGSPTQPPEALIGRVLHGRYRIDSVVARGGMGCVYRAEALDRGMPCALKVVTKADLASDEGDFEARFVREAATTARLRHPGCVSVLDFGETDDGVLYLAMELLHGTTVAEALRRDGPFGLPRFLHVARQVCDAVAAAHDLGIVHRDLKTANLFLCRRDDGDDAVKVLDFGIAKRMHDTALALTRPGQMLGTPKYMAPEQILGKGVDTRADVYSLGIVFFELLTGRVPFDGDNFLDVLAGHAREPVPPMAAVNPDIVVPPELEAMVQRMLAKEPDDRYANVRKVLGVLGAIDPSRGEIVRTSTPHEVGASRHPSLPPGASDRDAPTRVSRVPSVFPPAHTAPSEGASAGTEAAAPNAGPPAADVAVASAVAPASTAGAPLASETTSPSAHRTAARSRRRLAATAIGILVVLAVALATYAASCG